MRLLYAPVVFAVALAASPLFAEELVESLAGGASNILTNGNFNGSTNGWTAVGGTLAYSTLDARAATSSGSALVTNAASSAQQSVSASQCVARTGTRSYMLRALAETASGQARTGSASLYAVWYSSANCTGTMSSPVASASAAQEFDSFLSLVTPLTQPADTASLKVMLRVVKNEAGGTLQVHFDEATLYEMETLTVPAAASIHGASGTFFHSDLWVMNRSYTYPITVTARYRCYTGQSCGSGTKSFAIGPRRTLQHSDVVGTLLASPETAGAIELTYDPWLGSLSATSRVYTPSLPSPTSGAGIPARKPYEARAHTLFLGLGTNGGNRQSGFRSNAGAYNPNPTAVDVTFTLHLGSNGLVLGTPLTRTWAPHEAYQINDVFEAVGAGSTVATNAFLVLTASAPVFPFVTVIDNQSGDSIFVPPSEDEAP